MWGGGILRAPHLPYVALFAVPLILRGLAVLLYHAPFLVTCYQRESAIAGKMFECPPLRKFLAAVCPICFVNSDRGHPAPSSYYVPYFSPAYLIFILGHIEKPPVENITKLQKFGEPHSAVATAVYVYVKNMNARKQFSPGRYTVRKFA